MLQVEDSMTPEVVTISPRTSAGEALALCRERRIRHLPVMEDGGLVGIVSDRDLRAATPALGDPDRAAALAEIKIGSVMTREVATALPGDPIVELVSTGAVEIIVDGSEELFAHVRPGATTTLIGPAGTATVAARIAGVVPALDPLTRTMRIRLVPTDSARWMLPGAAVNVEFAIDLGDRGVVVPQDALIDGPTETRIVRVAEDKAEHIQVNVLARAREDALVRGTGLSAGDRVVIRGNERLRPGQQVEVTE